MYQTSTTTSNPTYYTWTVSAVGANIQGASRMARQKVRLLATQIIADTG